MAHTPGGVAGLLDDQVQVAAAALDAYEATGEGGWLAWAEASWIGSGRTTGTRRPAACSTRPAQRGSEPGLLPARAKPVQDAPTPSPNGVAGIVGGAPPRAHRRGALARARATPWSARSPAAPPSSGLYAAAYLLAVDWHLSPATHLVIVGEPGDAVADRMHARRAGHLRAAPRRAATRARRHERRVPAPGHGRHGGRRPGAARIRLHRHELPPADTAETWQATLARSSAARGARAGGGLRAWPSTRRPRSARPSRPRSARCSSSPARAPARPTASSRASRGSSPGTASTRAASAPSPSPTRPPTRSPPGSSGRSARSPRTSPAGRCTRSASACCGITRRPPASGAASASPTRTTSGGCCAGSVSGPSATGQLLLLFGRHRLQHVPLTAGDQELFAAYTEALRAPEPAGLRRPDRRARASSSGAARTCARTCETAGTTSWWTSSRT